MIHCGCYKPKPVHCFCCSTRSCWIERCNQTYTSLFGNLRLGKRIASPTCLWMQQACNTNTFPARDLHSCARTLLQGFVVDVHALLAPAQVATRLQVCMHLHDIRIQTSALQVDNPHKLQAHHEAYIIVSSTIQVMGLLSALECHEASNVIYVLSVRERASEPEAQQQHLQALQDRVGLKKCQCKHWPYLPLTLGPECSRPSLRMRARGPRCVAQRGLRQMQASRLAKQ